MHIVDVEGSRKIVGYPSIVILTNIYINIIIDICIKLSIPSVCSKSKKHFGLLWKLPRVLPLGPVNEVHRNDHIVASITNFLKQDKSITFN